MVRDARPPGHDEPDDGVFSGVLFLLFLHSNPELTSPPVTDDATYTDDDGDSAVDDARGQIPIVESAAGAEYFPAPGAPAGPPPPRHPWAWDDEDLYEQFLEREYDEAEQARAIDELLEDRARDGVPTGWMRSLWRWAHVFGVEERVDAFLAEREEALGLDPTPRPTERDSDAPDLSMVEATRPERLYAALKYCEQIDRPSTVETAPREYGIARDVAIHLQGGLTRELIDRWLAIPPPDPLPDAALILDEDAPTSRLDELSEEFERGDISPLDLPQTWLTLWGWAHVFGVADQFGDYFEERRRVLGIPLFEPPDIEGFFAAQQAATETAAGPERLYAIINYYERIDPTGAVAQSSAPYLAVRDFAVGTLDQNLAQIYEALDELTRPAAEPSTEAIAPPTMTTPPPPSGGEALKSSDPHALEPHIISDPLPEIDSAIDGGVDDADGTTTPEEPADGTLGPDDDDDDERGVVQVDPPKMELDPDPRAGLDSAVDDASSKVPIVESRVGAEPFPAPAVPRSAWGGAANDEAPPAGAGREEAEPPPQTSTAGSGRRVAIIAAAVAAAVVAIVAGAALLGGGDSSPEVASTNPTATTDQPAASGSPANPSPTGTPISSFQLTDPPVLVICNDGSSFSGIEQSDGTFTDPDTGEVLSCG